MKHLTMTYTSKRGYCFSIPVQDADVLPLSAVQAVKTRSRIVFSTEELQFLNNRISENVKTIFTITAEVVEVSRNGVIGLWSTFVVFVCLTCTLCV